MSKAAIQLLEFFRFFLSFWGKIFVPPGGPSGTTSYATAYKENSLEKIELSSIVNVKLSLLHIP